MPPTNYFCTEASECLTTLPLTVFTQRNFVADFLQAKCVFLRKSAVLRFLRPPLGDFGATYDDHFGLIGKRVVDFLLVLIELLSLGVTAKSLRAIVGSKSAILLQRGPVDPKLQVEGVASTNHSSSQETRLNLNCLSYCIKIWTYLFVRFVTIHACGRQRTDRWTEFSSLYRVCITCSAVKSGFSVFPVTILLNGSWTGPERCLANIYTPITGLAKSLVCKCGQQQTMQHSVNTLCPLTEFDYCTTYRRTHTTDWTEITSTIPLSTCETM